MRHQNRSIVFIRSRYSVSEDEWAQVALIRETDPRQTFIGRDSILCPLTYSPPVELDSLLFGDAAPPEWIEFWEVVEVGTETEAAQMIEDDDGDEVGDEDLDCWEPPVINSQEIKWRLDQVVGVEKGTFGRKMLIADFDDEIPNPKQDRATMRLKSVLKGIKPVWHGRDLWAGCFVDHRPCRDVIHTIDRAFGSDSDMDYLLVQPVDLLRTSAPGVSPLGVWLSSTTRR